MEAANRIILPIPPRSWVLFRSGKGGDQAYWFIPLWCSFKHRDTEDEKDNGLPCDEFADTGYCRHTLSKKGRQNKENIERYNKYRMDLFHLAKTAGFELPATGMSIYYYYPVPIRWSKKKKLQLHGQFKLSKPDITNLNKGFEDALTVSDEGIVQISGSGKFWFHPDMVEEHLKKGYIEIFIKQALYNPFGVNFINPYTTLAMEDIESRRAKRKQRKAEIEAAKAATLPKRKRKVKPIKLLTDELR